MGLPIDPKTKWPPAGTCPSELLSWSAWYAGHDVLPSRTEAPARGRFRAFFSRRHSADQERSRLAEISAALAPEIAQSSADLLFGDTLDLRVPNKPAQKRLDEIASVTGLHNSLLEAAEVCAALGGVYLRVSWDQEVRDEPFITALHPDEAVPEFAYGVLQAVTFFRELPTDKQGRVVRHLERHERGVILHGLYYGDKGTLGEAVDLSARPETRGLAPQIELPSGLPSLSVWYVPNALPQRRERHSPQGRADIAGQESKLAALDVTYSSLLRDIDLGKARIVVPADSFEKPAGGGRGSGLQFDLDREVFTELDGLDPKNAGGITVAEFRIRTQEHIEASLAWIERIISAAGYSPQTFGLRIEGRAESGTALRIREGKTAKTVARKQRYWAPAVEAACEALLAADRGVFGHKAPAKRPTLIWPEEQQTPQELAETLGMLKQAEAVSIETAVRRAQPELDEEKLQAEVERIRQESGSVVPEPAF